MHTPHIAIYNRPPCTALHNTHLLLLCSRVAVTGQAGMCRQVLYLQVAPQVPGEESEVYRGLYTGFKIYSLES